MSLPTDDAERKNVPIYDGFIVYFPAAIVEIAKHSFESNEQHNPGTPVHWDRSKSTNQLGSLARHLVDTARPNQSLDAQIKEARAIAWRALAHLQVLCEKRDSPKVTGSTEWRLKD